MMGYDSSLTIFSHLKLPHHKMRMHKANRGLTVSSRWGGVMNKDVDIFLKFSDVPMLMKPTARSRG